MTSTPRERHCSSGLALTGGAVVLDHPSVDWNNQSEHIVYDALSEAAHALVAADGGGKKRIIEFHEFRKLLGSKHGNQGLEVSAGIIDGFTMVSKPLFWLRLVSF